MTERRWLVHAAVLALGVEAWMFSAESVDDAFISFRYARNLWLHGQLAYNVAEPPVEGFSNLLWTLLCAPCALFASPLAWSRLLASLLFGASMWLVVLLARRLSSRRIGAEGIALALCAAAPGFVYWQFAGLEVPLLTTLLLLCWWLADGETAHSRWFSPSLCALALTRIDAPVMVAGLLLGELGGARFQRAAWRRVLRSAGWVGLTLALQQVFRMTYFGDTLPNTVRAKSSSLFSSVLDGLHYVSEPFMQAPLFVLCALAPLFLRGPRARAERSAYTGITVLCMVLVYVICVGGDWMPLYRFVAPVVPVCALCVGFVLAKLAAQLPRERALAHRLLLLAVLLSPIAGLCAYTFSRAPILVHGATEMTELGRLLGTELEKRLPPGAHTADGTAGAQPYYSNLANIDMFGLNDRAIARAPVSPHVTFLQTGHRSGNGYEVLSRRPDALVFVAGRSDTPGEYVSETEIAFDLRFHAHYEKHSFSVSRPPVRRTFTLADVEEARGFLRLAGLVAQPRGFGSELVRTENVEFTIFRRLATPPSQERAVMAQAGALIEAGKFPQALELLERQRVSLTQAGYGGFVAAALARLWMLGGDAQRARENLAFAERMLPADYRPLLYAWVRSDPLFAALLE